MDDLKDNAFFDQYTAISIGRETLKGKVIDAIANGQWPIGTSNSKKIGILYVMIHM